jgi:uncharacterized repeat protein (TIGR02543 family)
MKTSTFISKQRSKAFLLTLLLCLVGMINVKAQTYTFSPSMQTYTDCGSGTYEGMAFQYSSCNNASGTAIYQQGQVHVAVWAMNSSGRITFRVQKCSGYFKNGNSGKVLIFCNYDGSVTCSNFSISGNTTDYVTAYDYWTLGRSTSYDIYLITSDEVYKFYAGHITVTANYSISASASPSAGGSVSGTGSYAYNTYCTLSASPNSGYSFVRWTKDGSQVSTSSSYRFKVTANASYVAEFERDSYTISASASPSSGGSVSGAGTYYYGNTCNLTASPSSGYRFVRWTKNGSQVSTSSSYSFTVTGNASYVAEFEQSTYTISASASPSNGGSVSGAGTYNQGQTCTLTATPNTGYTFTRWTKNGSQVSTNASYSFTVSGNATYVAEFTQASYTISASANPSAGGSVSGAGTYSHGSSCTLTATPATGYSFVRWMKNGSSVSTSTTYSFTVTANATFEAVFSQNSYTIGVSASPSNGGTVSGAGTYNHGANCTLSASANPGYTFSRWTKSGTQVSTNSTYSFSVTASASYVAEFSQSSYTITTSVNPSAGGTVTGGGSFTYGQTCSLTATANSGYTFSNWTEGSTVVSTSANYSFTVTGNRTLKANFTANPVNYTIAASANPSAGGTVSGAGSYQQGQTCNLTATANTGYSFVNWTEGNTVVSTNASYSFTVSGNRTLVANFEAVQTYHWTVNINQYPNNATIVGVIKKNGTEQTVTTLEVGAFCGTECRGREKPMFVEQLNRYIVYLTVFGNDGDVLNFRLYDHVAGQEVNLTCSNTITFAPNATIGSPTSPYVFEFASAPTTYTIAATANPASGGTVSGAGTYNQGQTCSLTATPSSGYTFTNWTEGGSVVSSVATYSFTVTGNRTLVANFASSGPITQHWTVENSGAYSMTMGLTGVIKIEGVEQYSDQLEVGAFCGDECRGSAIASLFSLTGRYLVNLSVVGESGHEFTFKLYDHGLGQELDYSVPNPVSFSNDGYGTPIQPYELNFTPSLLTHTQALASGWNWYSTYIDQQGIDGLAMLESSLGSNGIRIQSKSNGYADQFEYGGTSQWYGNLQAITNEQMYMIRTNTACEAVITGHVGTFSQFPITVNSGWNWIGYPGQGSAEVGVALSGFTAEPNDQIKSKSNGYSTYVVYGNTALWYGSLSELVPGQGYMFKSNSSQSKTLVYQNGRGETPDTNGSTESNFFQPSEKDYAYNMTVTAVVELDGEELRSEDYELAAFAGDECRGSAKLMYVDALDRYMAFLLVSGEAEETIQFVLTDGSSVDRSGDDLTYTIDGTFGTPTEPVVIHFEKLGVGEVAFDKVHVYPNPSEDVFNVEGKDMRKIEVVNAYGQVVYNKETRENNVRIDMSNRANGVYLLRVVTDRGIKTQQIIKK